MKEKNRYAVLLCRKGSTEVRAILYDNYERKTDVMKAVWEEHPMWNIKAVHKLYDEDFQL